MKTGVAETREEKLRSRQAREALSGDLTEAILAAFIRYGIPPLPSDYDTRRKRYCRELADLGDRAELPQSVAEALRTSEYRQQIETLRREFENDAARIRTDPKSYRFWTPTSEAWRKLALAQLMEHEPSLQISDSRISTKGDRLFLRSIYAERARMELATRHRIEPQAVEKKAAAQLTAEKIAAAKSVGMWPYAVVEAGTIEEAWNEMCLDEGQLQIPSAVRRHHRATDHIARVFVASDRLGWASRLPLSFSDFRPWADERVDTKDRLPKDVSCWACYGEHMKNVATDRARENYRKLVREFAELSS